MSTDKFKYCPGLIHLRAELRKLVAATGAVSIVVEDEEDVSEAYTPDETGICAAADFAPELDGVLRYIVGDAAIQVIYDGPYSEDSAAEIINDCNDRASEILDA